jgi:antitoxin ParD1/3/4
MNIEIPSEFGPFVQQMISSGNFRDEKEMLIEGLRLLKSRERLREEVNAGIEQLESGQGLDGEEVLLRLEQRARRISARNPQ